MEKLGSLGMVNAASQGDGRPKAPVGGRPGKILKGRPGKILKELGAAAYPARQIKRLSYDGSLLIL